MAYHRKALAGAVGVNTASTLAGVRAIARSDAGGRLGRSRRARGAWLSRRAHLARKTRLRAPRALLARAGIAIRGRRPHLCFFGSSSAWNSSTAPPFSLFAAARALRLAATAR